MKQALQILSCLVFLIALSFFSTTNSTPPSTFAQAAEGPACRNNPIEPPTGGGPSADGSSWEYKWQSACQDAGGDFKNVPCNGKESTKGSVECRDAYIKSHPLGNQTDAARDIKQDDPINYWCYGFSNGNYCMKLTTDQKSQIPFGGISLGATPKNIARDALDSMRHAFVDLFQKIAGKNFTDPNAQAVKDSANAAADKLKAEISASIDSCLTQADDIKSACLVEIGNKLHNLKVAYRLADFYEMTAGKLPNTCVKADLGVKPRLAGKSYDKAAELRRLLLCTSSNGEILKWRVMPAGGTADLLTVDKATGTGRVRVTEIDEVEEDATTGQWVVKKVKKQFAVSASGPSSGIGSADEVKTFLQPQITAAIAELKQAGISTGQ